jgi:hypothetical protein
MTTNERAVRRAVNRFLLASRFQVGREFIQFSFGCDREEVMLLGVLFE